MMSFTTMTTTTRISSSVMALLLLLLVVFYSGTTGSVSAFTIVSPRRHTPTTMTTTRLLSSSTAPEPTTTDVTSSSSSEASSKTLSPEFEQAYEKSSAVLKASLDEDKQALLEPLLYFMKEYFVANYQSHEVTGDDVTSAQSTSERFLDGIALGLKFGMGATKYRFGVSHTAMRGLNPDDEEGNTRDYYAFGCDFFRPCMNIGDSLVLGKSNLDEAFDYIEKGENVVFLANHQSEADPQVFSCMLETVGYGKQAEDVVYVAGHKVTTDPLAIPFSMGRNLVCIHSKKHIDSDSETKPLKQKQNLLAMNSMLKSLKEGGCALWVAPSGGRDRRNVETSDVPLAPFDSKTLDMFRLMGNKSKVPTHYYPLAMVSYDLCPPPDEVTAGVGEERNVRFVPVGIACGEELESVGGLEKRQEFCANAMKATQDGYDALLDQLGKKKKQQ